MSSLPLEEYYVEEFLKIQYGRKRSAEILDKRKNNIFPYRERNWNNKFKSLEKHSKFVLVAVQKAREEEQAKVSVVVPKDLVKKSFYAISEKDNKKYIVVCYTDAEFILRKAVTKSREEASNAFLPEQGRRATEIATLKIKLKAQRRKTSEKIFEEQDKILHKLVIELEAITKNKRNNLGDCVNHYQKICKSFYKHLRATEEFNKRFLLVGKE